MVRLVTNSMSASARSRRVGIRLATLTLRLRENWSQAFGDPDTAAIALAIVATTSERLLRDNLCPDLENLERPFPNESLASCNINSIATATGFNRETARRKIDQLVRMGMVVRDGSQVRLSEGLTQQPEALEVVRLQMEELRKAVNELLREGIFEVQD